MSRVPVALLLWALVGCAPDRAPEAGPPSAEVSVGIHVIHAEVADTAERRARGLSGRESLAANRGMLFAYAVPERHGFWMIDMRFDIDIVWIRGDRVVDITHRARHDPPGELPILRPAEPADLVLEVPAGTAERLGWQIGDPVAVDPPLRPIAGESASWKPPPRLGSDAPARLAACAQRPGPICSASTTGPSGSTATPRPRSWPCSPRATIWSRGSRSARSPSTART